MRDRQAPMDLAPGEIVFSPEQRAAIIGPATAMRTGK
jgi:hypothetical protein